MTRVKSLKYEVEKIGKGHVHRIHRAKKNRRHVENFEWTREIKRRKESIKSREMDREIDNLKIND